MCPKICQFAPSERSARVFATLVPFFLAFSTLFFSMYDVCFLLCVPLRRRTVLFSDSVSPLRSFVSLFPVLILFFTPRLPFLYPGFLMFIGLWLYH